VEHNASRRDVSGKFVRFGYACTKSKSGGADSDGHFDGADSVNREQDINRSNRARWLAELDEALREAERLTTLLSRHPPESRSAMLLRTRIKAARTEVAALQQGANRARFAPNSHPLQMWWRGTSSSAADHTP